MMKRILLLVLVVIVAAGVWTLARRGESSSAPTTLGNRASPGVATHNGSGSVEYRDSSRSPLPQHASRLPDYSCTQTVDCDFDVIGATSEEEARWLTRSGYPTRKQLTDLEKLSVDQLLKLARQGDAVAGVVAGKELVSLGKTEEGLATLFQSSLNGSVYASYAFAEAYFQDERIRNPLESAAYYRLAYLQGDWKAAAELYKVLPNLDSLQLAMADKRAMRLYEGLNAQKVAKGKPVVLSLRPTSKDGQ